MQETQATAAALEHVPGPGTNNDTYLYGHGQPDHARNQAHGLSIIGGSWSPEEFENRIKVQKRMREILKEYVKSELKLGYHYADHIGNQKLEKPMLLQEGARSIAALFGIFFGNPQTTETHLDGDHFRVRAHIGLFNQAGIQITSGDGICSSRETKYAYRKSERECPSCGKATVRKSKYPPRNDPQAQPGWYCNDRDGGCGAQFAADDKEISEQTTGRIDNPDLADTENTVLKMAIKRAKVAAVCDLPVVSELFAPEGGGPGSEPGAIATGSNANNNSSSPNRAKGSQAPRNGQASSEPSPAPPSSETATDVVVRLVKKLTEAGEPIADLKELYLPAGVAEFEALSPEQAEEIRNDLVTALNAKLRQSN